MTAPASSFAPDPLPLRALLDEVLLLRIVLAVLPANYWIADEIYPYAAPR